MVVLTRRPHEKLLIPAINASLYVAAIEPGVVRVAIEAPPEVAVLRGELHPRGVLPEPCPERPAETTRRLGNESVQERLRTITRALGLARLELSAGLTRDAGAMLRHLHRELQQLRRELGGRRQRPAHRATTKVRRPLTLERAR